MHSLHEYDGTPVVKSSGYQKENCFLLLSTDWLRLTSTDTILIAIILKDTCVCIYKIKWGGVSNKVSLNLLTGFVF